MTVSRSSNRGNRAGVMRPSSRNKRVKWNAGLKAMTNANDSRSNHRKMSREEWVIRLVTSIVGAKKGVGFVSSDDIASDIILELLDTGGFSWDEDAITSFCHRRAASKMKAIMFRKEIPECEMMLQGQNNEFSYLSLLGSYPAPQDKSYDAKVAYSRLQAIPHKQRQALEILCDGGNPLDVAEEMSVTPYLAITLIKEGREYVDRVDPFDD